MTHTIDDKKYKIFELNVHALTKAETITHIIDSIERKITVTHAVLNVAEVVWAQKNKALCEAINRCDLISADGMGFIWGARFLGYKFPERVAATDLMFSLLETAQKKRLRVYFLGASAAVVSAAVQKLQQTYPKLLIAGFHHGYFEEDESPAVIDLISACMPDMVFVAMPSPKKECFMARYQSTLSIPFMMGVGGALDIVAGKITRAPKWMQQMGLEWFHRLLQEPKRMWKRYLVTNTVFLGMLVKAKILCSLKKSY